MTIAALSAQGLSFHYGSHAALLDVAIEVPAGQFVALLGSNGAGKTTLFSIVTGLFSAGTGQVSIKGHDLDAEPLKALACMGVVFQRTTLDMDLSVQQNLVYAAALQGMERIAARQRIAASVQTHGLAGLENRKVAALSGGQRRRVELARALLHEPALVLLDEPTVGLDMTSRQEFVAHVRSLCTEQTTGVLWASHLLDEITDEDDAVILQRGVVKAAGNVRTLREHHHVSDVPGLFASVASAGGDSA